MTMSPANPPSGSAQGLPGVAADVRAEQARWTRRFWQLWLLVLGVRVVYAAVFPLGLAPDESYYWDWGRRLDIGYYSKPPMIGWLMGLAGWVGHDSMFGLKLFPVLLVSTAMVFVFLLGRDLYDDARAGFWAAALFLASPANAALSTFFTIDPPLVLFWSASLWCAWRWLQAGARWDRWFGAWVLAMGLGALSKQIHLLFGPLLIASLAATPAVRRPGVWPRVLLGLGLSLAFLLPPLLWNWRHDWITFRHTASEIDHPALGWSRSLKFLGEFAGGQAGLGGGLTWVLMVGAAVAVAWGWRRQPLGHRFLWVFFVPGIFAFTCFALTQRVEQNWPLIFYVAGLVMTAGELTRRARGQRWARRVLVGAVTMGAILGVALMGVPFVVPRLAMAGTRSDPTARLRGWDALAREVEVYRQQLPRRDRTFLLSADDRSIASSLAYYLPDRPRTYVWEDPQHPESQYGIWGRPLERVGEDALVIDRSPPGRQVQELAGAFATWKELGEIEIALGGAGTKPRRYRVFWGQTFRGAPAESKESHAAP